MEEFLYVFRGGDAREVALSPELAQDHMQKWGAWMQRLSETGNLISGQPLQAEGKVVENAGDVITDGPFAEGKEVIGGYLLIKASDLANAVELSKECPIFEHGGTVEVRPIASIDM